MIRFYWAVWAPGEMVMSMRRFIARPFSVELVANGTLPYDKIIAVGYGSMRPLATNATEKGRAINRRIDITISPAAQTAQ